MSAQTAATIKSESFKGIGWMLVYAALISGMHIGVRFVADTGMHPFEIAFFRNIFGLIMVIPWFIRFGWQPLKTNRLGMLIARGAINTICMLSFFMALSFVPLAEVTALSFTAPIFATLLAILVFGEKIGYRRWGAIFLGLSGVFIILRPGFEVIGLGQWLVLTSAIGWGVCLIIIKLLGKTESAVTITTYMSLVMAPMTFIPALFYWTWPTGEQFGWLIVVGMLGGGGQLAMTQSLRLADTHVVTPFDYTRLLFVALLGYLIFDQIPDRYVWLGGTLIFISVAFIAYREHVRKAVQVAEVPIQS